MDILPAANARPPAMRGRAAVCGLATLLLSGSVAAIPPPQQAADAAGAALALSSSNLTPSGNGPDSRALRLDGLFFETLRGRTPLPASLTAQARFVTNSPWTGRTTMPDGRAVTLAVTPQSGHFVVSLKAQPDADIMKWGLAVEAGADEYYSGLMERVIDGPQAASWAPGLTAAMNLRGQKVDMLVKPTTSVYAPFYLSSRGYAVFVKGNWPGVFDFASTQPDRVRIDFEGPSFEMKVYTGADPLSLVRVHAMEAGPPVMPPSWMY
jgi:alpha-D-xyloside xylohydrolase